MTIDDIEGPLSWGPKPSPSTSLMERCFRLRSKPLSAFTPADVRLLANQGLSLPIIIPMALEILVANPLTDAVFFPGDLLVATMRRFPGGWKGIPDEQRQRLHAVLSTPSFQASLDDSKEVVDAIRAFLDDPQRR